MSVKLLPKHVGCFALLENGEVHEIVGKSVRTFIINGCCYNPDGTPFAPHWQAIGIYHVVRIFDPSRLIKAAEAVVKNYDVHRHPFIRDLKDALPKKGK